VTDMSQPLGEAVGNALDVAEAVAVLRGERPGRLADLTVGFASVAQEVLLGTDPQEGRREATEVLASGRAAEAFGRMVEAQGGDPRVVDDPEEVLPRADVVMSVEPSRSGFLVEVEAEAIGRAAIGLGAGRARKGDPIDPAVGLVFGAKVGDELRTGEPIGEVHARSEDAAGEAIRQVLAAMKMSDEPVAPPPLLYGWRDA
jgi:pyrimidine-nucleoside phosphorylase